jgi:glycosyltransferase involved in cell wall biosynthesis
VSALLFICPWPLLPLRGGGALRAFHLLRQLARFHEVHAIIFQPEAEVRCETEGYKIPDAVRVYSVVDQPPPRTWFDRLPQRVGPGLHYRWLRRSWRGPADSVLLQCHHLLRRILETHRVGAVLFEEHSAMMAAPLARRLQPEAARLLNAHNVNHRLAAQELAAADLRPEDDAAWRRTLWIEEHLGRFVHAFLACSDEDRTLLEECSGVKGYTVGNGVDTRFFAFDDRSDKAQSSCIIFSGWMETAANRDAVRFLLEDIWPEIRAARRDLRLQLVGGGMAADLRKTADRTDGVDVMGEVRDVRPFFQKAALALVPLRIGSGTRLKILEAMSQGTPVVSTHKGAEGLGAVDGEQLLLADEPDAFVQAVVRLLADRGLFDRLRYAGRAFVEQRYDWNVIGDLAARALAEVMEDHRTTGLRDYGTTGLQDYGTTGLRDYRTTRLRDHRTTGLRDL